MNPFRYRGLSIPPFERGRLARYVRCATTPPKRMLPEAQVPVAIPRGLSEGQGSAQYAICTKLMTVNLAPADLRKEGPAY